MDSSPSGSSVHRISQTRILEWVAISFSRGSSQPRNRTHLSCVSCSGGGFFTTGWNWEAHICVCVCIYIYIYIHTRTHIYIHTHIYIYFYVYVYIFIFIHFTYIYLYINIHTCVFFTYFKEHFITHPQFRNLSSWEALSVSHSHLVWFFATLWIVTYKAPLSMEFSRQEYWSLCSLLQEIFPTQGSNSGLLHWRKILHCLSYQGSLAFTKPFFKPWACFSLPIFTQLLLVSSPLLGHLLRGLLSWRISWNPCTSPTHITELSPDLLFLYHLLLPAIIICLSPSTRRWAPWR